MDELNLDEKEESYMSITATELKQNLSKYLLMAEREDVFITRNGKVVAKLTNPYQDRVDMAKFLFGIIPGDMTIEQAHRERLETVWMFWLINLKKIWNKVLTNLKLYDIITTQSRKEI